MGSRHIARISERLMAAGRTVDEPVALISRATTRRQRVVATTLGRCVDDLTETELRPPMLIVVGPTVSYLDKFGRSD